ncbi:MAG: DUF2332 domain-containing protein [Candidatus Kariarchaeaceae archaeon]|jgi:hypothetical protein
MQRSFDNLKKGFLEFGEVALNDGEILYKSICEIVVDSEYLLQITDSVPLGQPFPNILLGGVHFLILKGFKHELSNYYATTDPPKGIKPVDDNLKEIFIDFVKQYEEQIVEICKTKKVQTNEIGRCSFILPGLNYLNSLTDKPIILVEIGASGGLLLNYHKYGLRYSHRKQITGDPNSIVQLECEVIGSKVPPVLDLPDIKMKVGIDLYPVRCSNPDEALWLQSLVWPKHIDRFRSLKSALEICRIDLSSYNLVQGDGFRDIERYLENYTDSGSILCIYHSFAINQISKEEQQQYYNKLKSHTSNFDNTIYELRINWLPESKHQLVLHKIHKGEILTTELANVHHHGRWIEWLVG